ncbi:hypothetical protein [Nocardioides sp.]|uniref:hypothetical protein n=1 Tax=Nocardioides sp. TaxID=35761 RepID=UPI0039E3EE19
MLDSITWGVFAAMGTVLGGVGTWFAYQRRGARSAARWLAVTLLFPAAYLTRTLKMFGRIADAISDWALSFVWNPMVWVGIALGVVAVALFLVSGRLPSKVAPQQAAKPLPAGRAPVASQGDPELDEIEALLRKHGIS